MLKNGTGHGSLEDAPGQQVGSIVERIASAISVGMLAVGERLPAEIELASQFGVAVATLRKALASLRAKGIVETRRGRNGGTFVVKAPFPTDESLTAALAHSSTASLRDLADEHTAISSAAAQLAAERTSPSQRTRLAELAFRARETHGSQERSLADSRFHIEVAVLSHSQRLLTAEQRLQTETAPLLWCEAFSKVSVQDAFNDHLAMVMAIEQGNADVARQLAGAHVMSNFRRIIEAKYSLPDPLSIGGDS
ncbi:FadR family transcriptional regulator [Leucobacter denitrificans]|uniref:FadR family transcriptional regulator n=2 Tax=Leucobacter denitrificans TaxID=683042 RepID=A0A7G9S7X4_9MICO|nr:FadR family transcriptional regulator [Leucobacter denitrificans]